MLTGLRRGEITGLHWSDVDLAARTITVKYNRVSVDGKVQESTTKTRSGRRTLPLSDAAVAALLTGQLRQAGEAEAAPEAWQSDGHLFTLEDGRPLDPAYVTRPFQVIRLEGEPLPELTFHCLRHSAASLMLAAPASPPSRSCSVTPPFRSPLTCTPTWSLLSGSLPSTALPH